MFTNPGNANVFKRCIMLPRIIFCAAVILATLTVILLALIFPVAHKKQSKNHSPWLALSLYVQPPQTSSSNTQPTTQPVTGAFIFHHILTEGPENTSRAVGKAQGFIVPVEQFAHSAFNIVYLTFDTPDYSGSLSVRAKQVTHNEKELTVVGGTGSFAFARGNAVFAQTERKTYQVKLQLKFPNLYHPIPG